MSIEQVADIEWPSDDFNDYMVVQAIISGKHVIYFQRSEIAPISARALELMLERYGITYPKIDSSVNPGHKVPALKGPSYEVVGMGMAMSDPDRLIFLADSNSVEYNLRINREHLETVKQKYPDKRIDIE